MGVGPLVKATLHLLRVEEVQRVGNEAEGLMARGVHINGLGDTVATLIILQ